MEETGTGSESEQIPEEGGAPEEEEITDVIPSVEEEAETPSEEVVDEPVAEEPTEDVDPTTAAEDDTVLDSMEVDADEENTFKVTIADYRNILSDVTITAITFDGKSVMDDLESDGTLEVKTTKTKAELALDLEEKNNAVIKSVAFGTADPITTAPYKAGIEGDTTVTITTAPAYSLTVNTTKADGVKLYTYATVDNKVTPTELLGNKTKTEKPSANLEFSAMPVKEGTTLTVSYKVDGEIDETVLEAVEKDNPDTTAAQKKINFYTINKADIDSLSKLEIIVEENAGQTVTFDTADSDVVLGLWNESAEGDDKYTGKYDAEKKPSVIKGQTIKFKATVKEPYKMGKVVVSTGADSAKTETKIDPTNDGIYEVKITEATTISFVKALDETKCNKLSFTLTGEKGSATMVLTSLTKTGETEAKATADAIKAVLDPGQAEAFVADTVSGGVKVEAGKEYLIPKTVEKITLKVSAAAGGDYELVKVGAKTPADDAEKANITLTDITYDDIAAVAVETKVKANGVESYFMIAEPAEGEHIQLNIDTSASSKISKATDAEDKEIKDTYKVAKDTDIVSFTITADEGWELDDAYLKYLNGLKVTAGGDVEGVLGTDKKFTYTVRLLANKLGTEGSPKALTGESDGQKLTSDLRTFETKDENEGENYTIAYTGEGYGVTPAEGFSVTGDTYDEENIPYNAKLVAKVTADDADYRLTAVSYKLGENGTYVPCTIDTDDVTGKTYADVVVEKVTDNVYLKVETAENYTFTLTGVADVDKLSTSGKVYIVENTGKYQINTTPAVDVAKLSADIKDETGAVIGRGRRVAGDPKTFQIWMQKAWQGQELSVEVKKDGVKIGSDILLSVKKSRSSIVVNEGAAIVGNVANNKVIPITTDGEKLYDKAKIDVTGVTANDNSFAIFLQGKLSITTDGNLYYTGSAQKFTTVMKSKEVTGEGADAKPETVWENAQAKVVITDAEDDTVKSKAVIMTLNPVLDTQKAPTITVKDTSDVSIDVNISMDGVNAPDSGKGTLYYIVTATAEKDTAADPAKGEEGKQRPTELKSSYSVVEARRGASQRVTIKVSGSDLGGVSKGWNYDVTAKAVYSIKGTEVTSETDVPDNGNADFDVTIVSNKTGTATKDTYFASTLKLTKNGKRTPKAVSTVYSGQSSAEGLYVATLDWKDKKFTPYKVAKADVEDLTDNSAYGIKAVVNENDELVITSVPSWAKTGKHVLQVTAYADEQTGHKMYAARATINVTVARGIEYLSLTPAQTRVALPSGKNTVSVKSVVIYNGGSKTDKPKNAKAEFSVVDWEGKTPAGVTIDKKGTVKITSAFPYSDRYPDRNEITVKAKAADYPENGKGAVATITITNEPVDLTNLVIVKKGTENVTVLAKAGNSKATDVSALDLDGAYVYAMKEAVSKDSYTTKEWNKLELESEVQSAIKYTPEENAAKGKVAYVSGSGYVRVQKTGSVTITAAANDGSKNGKKSKATIKLNVKATETNSSAALVITYRDANGSTYKEITACKKPSAEVANKAEIKGDFQVSGAAVLEVKPLFAVTDEKTGAFKSYGDAKGFENYKITVKGGKELYTAPDGTEKRFVTTAKETTLTLTTGKGKDAKKYTYKLTNTAFKDSKPKITVVGTLYENTDADTQTISLKVLNGKENFPEKTTLKIETDRTVKNYNTALENALESSIVAVDGSTAELVFNRNYYYNNPDYTCSGFPAGTYKMLATVGKGTGTSFAAECTPVVISLKVVKRKAFTFKPNASYTINPAVDGGAVLTGKDNVKGSYKVDFKELQNANDGKGKSNKFTHYFKIETDKVTNVQTLVLNKEDAAVKALLYKPKTNAAGEVEKETNGDIKYTDEYLDELKLNEISNADLVGYVCYTAEANDKFYAPYKLENQYAKITVKLSLQKGDKVAKAAQKYIAETAMIKAAAKSTTAVNVKVNGQYVNVKYAIVDDAKAKKNAAELTNIAANDKGQITLEAASALDINSKKGYSTNVIIVPSTSIYTAVIAAENDAAKRKALIEKYGVSIMITVKAVVDKDYVETPAPVNPKPSVEPGGSEEDPGEEEETLTASAVAGKIEELFGATGSLKDTTIASTNYDSDSSTVGADEESALIGAVINALTDVTDFDSKWNLTAKIDVITSPGEGTIGKAEVTFTVTDKDDPSATGATSKIEINIDALTTSV